MHRRLRICLALLAFAVPAAAVEPQESPPQFQDEWNSCDVTPCYPVGTACDAAGNLHVVDLWHNTVRTFSGSGAFLGSWGGNCPDDPFCDGDGELSGAQGITLDTSGNIYIADTGNNRVQKFTSAGGFLAKWGSSGTGNLQFDKPTDIAVDGSGNIYVTDLMNSRVQKLSSSGAFVTSWGGLGTGADQLHWPRGIGVNTSGTVFVADSRNNRVMQYNSDGSLPMTFVSSGTGEGQVVDPSGIDVDAEGNVYVVDRGTCNTGCRVQKFSSDGVFLTRWGSDASGCQGDDCQGRFLTALDVAVTPMGLVFVSDLSPIDPVQQGRIQMFSFTVPALPSSWGQLKVRYE